MNSYNHYIGIDNFRLFAAFLVIAIHTSPLEMFSPVGDFILTRIIARLAVPFFFMASGFFLLGGCNYDSDKLKNFLKKALLIYIVAMLIYLPINIYNGYLGSENLLPTIVKDLLFNGTFYHLWYLPAGMLGGVIAWFSIKHLGVKNAILLSLFLYVIGL
ncbi:MAG: acyltransferase family protein, partial [Oscillospiraceae bacterium]